MRPLARSLVVLVLAFACAAPVAHAKVRVGASTNDLASIAATVGGPEVEVFSLAPVGSDPHRVEALPSSMVRVSRAQVFLKVGLGLDQWADAIVEGSRNARLRVVDCSRGVHVLEVPTGHVDASMGHVHPDGNPHYWLDPRNGAVVANTVAEALCVLDPSHAADYRARAAAFGREARAALERGRARVVTLASRRMFTYHRSWPYLADAYGFEIVSTVEPIPGIPPTARHLASLVATARASNVRLLLQEPYFSPDAGRFLAREASVRTVVASPSCASTRPGSYLEQFETLLAALVGEPAPGSPR